MQLSSLWRSQEPDRSPLGCLRENFEVDRFFKNFYCSQITSYLCQKCKKILSVNNFVSAIKHVENYPNFETSLHVIQNDLEGFIVENIEGGKES